MLDGSACTEAWNEQASRSRRRWRPLQRGELSFEFLDLPLYDRFSALSRKSFRDVGVREAIPLELLMVVREAMGFAQPDTDDPMREDEMRVVPILQLQLSRGFDPAVIERWLRVNGESLRRITETERDWWYTQVAMPRLESGLNAAEMLKVTNEWGDEFASFTEQAPHVPSLGAPTRLSDEFRRGEGSEEWR